MILVEDTQSDEVNEIEYRLALAQYLDAEWLREVAMTRDTELRCHRIALTYSKYAMFLDTWLFEEGSYWFGQLNGEPAKQTNANWFHFSTWAALTVSRNIGSIAAPQRFDAWPNVVRHAIAPYIVRARGTNHQAVSQALATAQLKIFVNTCLAFMDFLSNGEADAKGLRSDPTMREAARTGFEHYRHAKAAHQADAPALSQRYILLANIMSTVVEQHLIDDQLAAVIEAVPNRLTEVAEGRLGQLLERLGGLQRQVTEFSLVNQLAPARAVATTIWGRLLTDQVFVMSLPGEMLRVGRDVPPLRRNEPYYPKNLRRPENFSSEDAQHGSNMALLRDLIVRFDRTVGDGRGSGARDWRRYDERMNWAVTLLRSRQQDTSMFWPPYSEEDEEHIFNRRLPRRSGDATQIVAPLNNVFVSNTTTLPQQTPMPEGGDGKPA